MFSVQWRKHEVVRYFKYDDCLLYSMSKIKKVFCFFNKYYYLVVYLNTQNERILIPFASLYTHTTLLRERNEVGRAESSKTPFRLVPTHLY